MTLSLESATSLQAKLGFGIVATILLGISIVHVLVQIELNTSFKVKTPKDTKLEVEGNGNDEEEDTVAARPKRLRTSHKAFLGITVGILILLTYLLMVFLPSGFWLNAIAFISVTGVFLRKQIFSELRRQRVDRLVAILTLFIFVASTLSLATYARLAIQEGNIYQGPARIVGYDETNYENKDGEVLRTDLEVSWGGTWGCPGSGKQCQAFVNGALCETEQDYNNGQNRRMDENQDAGANDEENQDENVEQENEDLEEDNEELEDENEELEDENEDLEEENEDLEDENEELEDENEDLEEEVEELEEEIEEDEKELYYNEKELYYDYSLFGFEDDTFSDDYWNYEWSSVWGDYACLDLFETDLEGLDYDAEIAPGDDGWPFVNIYGKCNTCEAYLVDYYSEEHFSQIKSYQAKGRNYFTAGLVSFLLTSFLVIKQRLNPSEEKEIELLTNDGGTIA